MGNPEVTEPYGPGDKVLLKKERGRFFGPGIVVGATKHPNFPSSWVTVRWPTGQTSVFDHDLNPVPAVDLLAELHDEV